jgi:hypothetical protein
MIILILKYINLIIAISTTIIGSIISIYFLLNCNMRLYYYHIYKGITSGLVINISYNNNIYYTNIEYYVNNFKYLLRTYLHKNKYKLNDKLTIVYNDKNPQNALIYFHKNVINNKIAVFGTIIALILLWILFIYIINYLL